MPRSPTAFALAVTYPAAGNIGGGGFMLVWPGGGQGAGRHRLPRDRPGRRDRGHVRQGRSTATRHKVVGVPGTVRGLALAHKTVRQAAVEGRSSLPAVKLAEDGFALERRAGPLAERRAGRREDDDRRVPPRLRQARRRRRGRPATRSCSRTSAKTLRLIAEKGPDALLHRRTRRPARRRDEGRRRPDHAGRPGRRTRRRSASRSTAPTAATTSTARRRRAPAASAWSQMLNILENFDLKKHGRYSPRDAAPDDRGDAPGLPRPRPPPRRPGLRRRSPTHLTTKEYAKKLAAGIDPTKATPSEDARRRTSRSPTSGDSTTHFSVIDKDGMAVANTYTLEHSYGSRVVVRGAGFLLNNEMIDFNWRPGVTDAQRADRHASRTRSPPASGCSARRRRRSSRRTARSCWSPAAPAAGRSSTRCCASSSTSSTSTWTSQAAVDAPRLHHQWFPDRLALEERHGARRRWSAKLKAMGHTVARHAAGRRPHDPRSTRRRARITAPRTRRINGKAAGY